jgi:hypothetical protein
MPRNNTWFKLKYLAPGFIMHLSLIFFVIDITLQLLVMLDE